MQADRPVTTNKGVSMNRNIVLSLTAALALFTAISAGTRVSSIGSHPYYSVNAWPQDVMQWQGNFFYYYPNYMKAPWWGDIDEPGNKPDATYTTIGTEVADGAASFEHTGSMHTVNNQFGYAHQFANVMTSFDVNYGVEAMRNRAQGNFSHLEPDAQGDNQLVGFIPFDYSNNHMLNNLSLQGMAGFNFMGNAVGLRAKAGLSQDPNPIYNRYNNDSSSPGKRAAANS